LLKEIAMLKEKLVLYEVLDVDRVSIYESKIASSPSVNEEEGESQDVPLDMPPKKWTRTSKLKKSLSLQTAGVG